MYEDVLGYLYSLVVIPKAEKELNLASVQIQL